MLTTAEVKMRAAHMLTLKARLQESIARLQASLETTGIGLIDLQAECPHEWSGWNVMRTFDNKQHRKCYACMKMDYKYEDFR